MASIRILPLLNDVPMRLGIVSGGSFRLNYDRAFNLRVPCIDGEHSLERNLRLLDALGLGRPEWPWRSAAEWKARNPAPAGRSGIVLQPLSGPNVPGRDWPIDSFAGLARALLEAGVGPLCALAGAGQEARLERLPAEVRREIGLPLEQVCRRLMTARLVIGVDSGLAHLAALLGTPTLTLFGPTDETLVRPWGPLAQQLVADCPQRPCYRFGAPGRLRDCRDRICMSSIAVERAAERALQMLKQSAMTEAGDA